MSRSLVLTFHKVKDKKPPQSTLVFVLPDLLIMRAHSCAWVCERTDGFRVIEDEDEWALWEPKELTRPED